MSLLQTSKNLIIRLHDLWVLLAWSGLLTTIMVSTFYHRSCLEFAGFGSLTVTCQSALDLLLVLLAAVGAGIAFSDERMGVLGFLPAHAVATFLFIIVLMIPTSLGVLDPTLQNSVLEQIIVLAFNSQFPFALFLSLVGCPIGTVIGSKLPKKSILEAEVSTERY